MRPIFIITLLLAATSSAIAQQRGAFVCTEEVSIRFGDPKGPEDAKTQPIPARKFSITWYKDLLNLIAAAGTDFYECQPVIRRLNEAAPKNAIKCQNGIYFFTLDMSKLQFVKAQLNPQDKTEIGVSFGTCKPI